MSTRLHALIYMPPIFSLPPLIAHSPTHKAALALEIYGSSDTAVYGMYVLECDDPQCARVGRRPMRTR